MCCPRGKYFAKTDLFSDGGEHHVAWYRLYLCVQHDDVADLVVRRIASIKYFERKTPVIEHRNIVFTMRRRSVAALLSLAPDAMALLNSN